MAHFWGIFSKVICRLSCVLFIALFALHVSGAYAADGCTAGNANSNNMNSNMYCTSYTEEYVQFNGTDMMYYDCTACENGVSPHNVLVDGLAGLGPGCDIYAGQCFECYSDSDCGTDGWEYTAPGTEMYKEWSCGGNYCHWEYTNMRCDTGYEPGDGVCEVAPTCTSTYSCSGSNWVNDHDLVDCNNYSTFCFDIVEGQGSTPQQLFTCNSCKSGYTLVTRYYDPDISGCDTYSYDDCECQKTDSAWSYNSSGHYYSRTVVNQYTCTESTEYECAAGYYGTGGSCTACHESFTDTCSVSNGTGERTCYHTSSSRGSTSASDCSGSSGCTTCCAVSCTNGYHVENCACVQDGATSCDANEYLDGGTCYDCPNTYPYSGGGIYGIGNCYRSCTTSDVDYSTNVTGNYYQDGDESCCATSCSSGYRVENCACVVDCGTTSCPSGYRDGPSTYNSCIQSPGNVCYKSCTKNCSGNDTSSCPSHATCTYDTSYYTEGSQYYGGSCDASSSLCPVSSVSCSSDYYLTNNDECDSCPSGCTCAGGTAQPVCAVSCDANEYLDGGTCRDCPSEYPYSSGGSYGWDYCYRDCETSDVDHATGVTGNYYWDDTNACEATGCAAGYYRWRQNSYSSYSCVDCPSGCTCAGGTAQPVCSATCSAGQYPNGNTCGNCTNKPANSTYTGVGTTATNCPWECNSGYTQSGNSCVEDGPTCSAGQYPNGNTCGNCTNKPANSTYTGVGTTATNCPWECDSGYTQSGNSCVSGGGSSCTGATYWDSSQSRCVACPEGYDYNTSNGKTSINQCQIHCDAGTTVWWPNNGYSRVTAVCPSTPGTSISTGIIPGSTNVSGTLSVIPIVAQPGMLMTLGSNTYLYANGSGGYTLYTSNGSISRSGGQGQADIEYAFSPVATLTVGGSTTTGNTVVGTPTGAFALLDGNSQGAAGAICIHHATLTVDGMRVLDLTPVKNDNSGNVALYDSVGGLLYGDNTGGSLYSYNNESSNTNYQCIDPGVGKYATAATINYGSFGTRGNCTNAPEHATYISSGTSANSCEWECDSGYVGSSLSGDTECADDESTFSITTTSGASALRFSLQATGTFTVDCGTDGKLTRVSGNGAYCGLSGNTITISRVTLTCVYQCAWAPSAGVHTITFGGTATDYAPNTTGAESCSYPTFRINDNYAQYVASVAGNMSRVFPYKTGNAIYNARQPRFCHAFQNCTNLTTISDGLFRDYTKAANNAFHDIFNGCSSLTAIPPHLFSHITEVSGFAFCGAFLGCSSVPSIPSTLWSGLTTISGNSAATRAGVFQGTFRDMTSVSAMPENLFAGVSAANTDQFRMTFDGCSNMGSYIPPSTFGGLVAAGSPQDNSMWYHTFYDTQLLTACPAGTIQFITQYEGNDDTINWGGKVSCEPCPTGYTSNQAQTECVPQTSTVSLNANGGTNGATTSVTATYNSAMPTIASGNLPTRTGYTFGGFYDTDESTGGTQYYTSSGASAHTWDKTGNQTLYARWTAQTSTVTLNANGGTDGATTSVTATYDSAMPGIPAVNLPTRTGYTFEGFYDTNAATGGTQYYTSSGASARTWNKTGTQTLYARWTANTYTITLDDSTNGGSGGSGTAKEVYNTKWTNSGGTTITSVTIPTKGSGASSAVFMGYYDAASGGNQKIPATGVLPATTTFTADTTLKAQFADCTCTKGNNVASCTVTGVSSNKCTYSYTCNNGYHVGSSGTTATGTFTATNAATASNTSPNCSGNTITLTWANGGHGTAPTTPANCTYGGTFTTAAAITGVTGYTFNNWSVNSKTFSASASSTACNYTNLGVYSGTATITATWNATTSTVTLNKNTSSSDTTTVATVTATYDAAMPTKDTSNANLTAPTRTGYTFAGYYDARTGGTQYYTAALASAKTWDKTGAQTLYARWSVDAYTVTLDKNSADATAGTASVSPVYGAAMPTTQPNLLDAADSTLSTKGCHKDTGVYPYTDNGTQYYNLFFRVQPNTSYTYTVATKGNRQGIYEYDTVIDPNSYSTSNKITPSRVIKAGGSAGLTTDTFTTGANAKMVMLYLGTTTVPTGVKIYPTAQVAEAAVTMPTRTGYNFAGYYDTNAATGGTQYYTSSGASAHTWDKTGNQTLYARWTAKTCTVTFKTGNKTMGTQNFTYGTAQNLTAVASLSNVPVSSTYGWSFEGWATSVNTSTKTYANSASVNNFCDNGDVTLYGIWKRTVPFKYYNGASATSTTTSNRTQYYYNTSTTAAAAGAVSTYVLATQSTYNWAPVGWVLNSTTSTTTASTATTTAGNVTPAITAGGSNAGPTYYALYSRTATVAYNANGGSGTTASTTGTQYFNAGGSSAIALNLTLASNSFTKTGHTFTNWTAGSTTGVPYLAGATYTFPNTTWSSTDTYTMYARWEANTYDITYYMNGGTPAYTQVEYLTSSTAKQYVDTGVTFEVGKDIRVVTSFSNPSTSYRKVLTGNYKNDNVSVFALELGGSGQSKPGYFRNYTSAGGSTADVWSSAALPANTLISVDASYDAASRKTSNVLKYGTTTLVYQVNATSAASDAATRSLRLFYDYRTGSEIAYAVSIGATRIYKDGTLVANLIPARRNSDNVLGMYNTLTGQFNTSSGTFTAGADVGPLPSKYTYGIGATIAAGTPTRDHSTFAGWCTNSALTTCDTTQTIATTATGAKTYYAKWTCDTGYTANNDGTACVAQTSTVTLNKNTSSSDTTTVATVTATYDASMPTKDTSNANLTAPTRTGYTFAGYYDARTGGTQYYTAALASAKNWDKTGAQTLYAHWTAQTSTVTLNKNTSSSDTTTVTTVTATYDAAMPLKNTSNANLAAPTRSKANNTTYAFNGYYDARTGGTQYYTAALASAKNWDKTGAQTLYAQWTMTCDAGYYLPASSLACSACTDGNYCPGGTAFTYSTSAQGINSCTTNAGSQYTHSGTGSANAVARDAVTDCYVTTTAGKYVATANANTQTNCTAGDYCPSTDIFYGATGGRLNCNTGTTTGIGTTSPWTSAASATARTSCYRNITLNKNGMSGTLTLPENSGCKSLTSATGATAQTLAVYYDTTCTLPTTALSKSAATTTAGLTGTTTWATSANAVNGFVTTIKTTDTASSITYYAGRKISCVAGYYLAAGGTTACTICSDGNYCPGVSQVFYDANNAQGINSCTATAPAAYSHSNKSAVDAIARNAVDDCYATTTAGKWIAEANAGTETNCSTSFYCPGGTNVFYGTSGGRLNCNTGTAAGTAETPWTSDAGATARTSCYRDVTLDKNSMSGTLTPVANSGCKAYTANEGSTADVVTVYYNTDCTLPDTSGLGRAASGTTSGLSGQGGWSTSATATSGFTNTITVTTTDAVPYYAGRYISCVAGYYLKAKGSTACTACTAGNYCEGLTNVLYSTSTQGLSSCATNIATGWTSVAGASATSINKCYYPITLNKNGYSFSLTTSSGTGCKVLANKSGTTTPATLRFYYDTDCTLPTFSGTQTGYTNATAWSTSADIASGTVTTTIPKISSATVPAVTAYWAQKPSCAANYYKSDTPTCSACSSLGAGGYNKSVAGNNSDEKVCYAAVTINKNNYSGAITAPSNSGCEIDTNSGTTNATLHLHYNTACTLPTIAQTAQTLYTFEGLATSANIGASAVSTSIAASTENPTITTYYVRKINCSANAYKSGDAACTACPTAYPYNEAGTDGQTACYAKITLNKNGFSGAVTAPSNSGCEIETNTGTNDAILHKHYNTACTLPTTTLTQTGYADTTTWAASNTIGAAAVATIAASTSAPNPATYYARKTGCVSPYYKSSTTACSACSSLATPSSGWVTGGTYSSVSPYDANTTCRYKVTDMANPPTNCATVTTNTVSYAGSAWNTDFYTVTSVSGKYITSNNNSTPACSACPTGFGNSVANATANTQCYANVTLNKNGYSGTLTAGTGTGCSVAETKTGTTNATLKVYYNTACTLPTISNFTQTGYTSSSAWSTVNTIDGATTTGISASTSAPASTIYVQKPSCAANYYKNNTTTCSTCSSLTTNGFYGTSAAGNKTDSSVCTGTTTAGNYVATPNAEQTACVAGGYCPGSVSVAYGSTGGMTVCADNKWSNAGASSCTACTTAKGYGNTGTDVASHAGKASCTVTCTGGQYVASAGAGCTNVGAGYWCAGGTVDETATLARTACASGLTTIGYGTGADGVGDCGHKFHVGNDVIYLRSAKRTNPSLNVKIGGTTFYGNMSLVERNMSDGADKKLKIKDNGVLYHVYDDSIGEEVELPSDYIQIPKITDNRDTYIDTNLTVNDFDRVTARVKLYEYKSSSGSNDYPTLFGSTANSSSGSNNAKTFRFYNGSSTIPTCSYGDKWASTWATPPSGKFPLNTATDVDVKLAAGEQYIKYNGVTNASGTLTKTLTNNYNVTIFAMNYAGNKRYYPHLDCEGMKFYKGNEVVLDLIPVRKVSSNECGLYDVVNGTFYGGAVSGKSLCP